MAERKYTRSGEKPVRYECTNRKCKWQGFFEEKSEKKDKDGWTVKVCPKCGKDEFYGLIK